MSKVGNDLFVSLKCQLSNPSSSRHVQSISGGVALCRFPLFVPRGPTCTSSHHQHSFLFLPQSLPSEQAQHLRERLGTKSRKMPAIEELRWPRLKEMGIGATLKSSRLSTTSPGLAVVKKADGVVFAHFQAAIDDNE